MAEKAPVKVVSRKCDCGAATFNDGSFNATHKDGHCELDGKGADGNGHHVYVRFGMFVISRTSNMRVIFCNPMLTNTYLLIQSNNFGLFVYVCVFVLFFCKT